MHRCRKDRPFARCWSSLRRPSWSETEAHLGGPLGGFRLGPAVETGDAMHADLGTDRERYLHQEAVDAAGRPGRDATGEKVCVLSPDRTAKSEGGCKNWPVLRIACPEPFPRFGFEIAIEVQADQSPSAAMDLRNDNAFAGSPPCFTTNLAKCSSASAYAVSGMKKDTLSA